MRRLAIPLLALAVLLPAGLALHAQESPLPTGEKLDDLIESLKAALAEAEDRPERQPIRFELRIYDIRDLTHSIRDYPGESINLIPSGGFGFGFGEDLEVEPMPFYQGDAIADMVRDNIVPASWDELRSVDVQYRMSGLLLVRHTPAVHEMIADMLAKLRARAAAQITMRVRLVRTADAVLRRILGDGSPFVLDDGGEARLVAAVEQGTADVVYEGSISCTNTQMVALRDWVQVSYVQDYDVEIAQASGIPDPIVQTLLDGSVIELRPVVAGDGNLVILQVKAEHSRLVRPIEALKLPLGTIETPELDILKLHSTLALPLGGTAVVGGALGDGDPGAVLVLVTPVATRHGGR
jgi:hypothetical protein